MGIWLVRINIMFHQLALWVDYKPNTSHQKVGSIFPVGLGIWNSKMTWCWSLVVSTKLVWSHSCSTPSNIYPTPWWMLEYPVDSTLAMAGDMMPCIRPSMRPSSPVSGTDAPKPLVEIRAQCCCLIILFSSIQPVVFSGCSYPLQWKGL